MRISDWSSDVCSSDLVDRSDGLPALPDNIPPLSFPPLQSAALANGIEVVLAERSAVPLVSLSIQFDAGRLEERRVGKELIVRVVPGCSRISNQKNPPQDTKNKLILQ